MELYLELLFIIPITWHSQLLALYLLEATCWIYCHHLKFSSNLIIWPACYCSTVSLSPFKYLSFYLELALLLNNFDWFLDWLFCSL